VTSADRDMMRAMHRFLIAVVALALLLLAACGGGTTVNPTESLARLRTAIDSPVSTNEQGQENSRLVEQSLEENVFDDMMRSEVEEAIGRGDPCSRHPRCAENGFEPDDWFYTVGQMGEGSVGALPIMILGFDRTGRVVRSWNLSTH